MCHYRLIPESVALVRVVLVQSAVCSGDLRGQVMIVFVRIATTDIANNIALAFEIEGSVQT